MTVYLKKVNNVWYANDTSLNTANYVKAYTLAVTLFPNAKFKMAKH